MKPEPGSKVLVQDVAPGLAGKLRAGRVRPATSRPVETIRVWPEPWADFEEGAHWEQCDHKYVRFDPASVAREHPEWVNTGPLADACLAVVDAEAPVRVASHPLFAPWEGQITDSAATALQLRFAPASTEASPSRAFPKTALLEAEWPLCSACREPLELVLYLRGSDFGFIGNEGSYFAAFLCNVCCDEVALGAGPWRFEHGTARDRHGIPFRARSPKFEMPEERALDWSPVRSFPDPRTLAAMPGAASEVLSVIVRKQRQPDPRFPTAPTEERERASSTYRDWLHMTGERSQLGGFLNWRHDLDGEHPKCADCGKAMRLLAALSEEDSGMPLGDDVGGTLYFFFCDRSATCGAFSKVRVVHQFM